MYLYNISFTSKGIINMPTNDHFNAYIYNLKENDMNIGINRNYYYNGIIRNAEIIINDLSIKNIIEIILVLCLYMKKKINKYYYG